MNRKKKLKITTLVLIIILLLTPSNSVLAEITSNTFAITPLIGAYYFDESQSIERDSVYGLGLAYNFTPNWAAELMYLRGKFRQKYYSQIYDDCCCCDLNAQILHLSALYHFKPKQKLNPYVAIGMGQTQLDYNCKVTEDDYMANYGGGIKYSLSENFSIRGDIRHRYSFEHSQNNLVVTLGLTYQHSIRQKVQEKIVIPEPLPQIEPEYTQLKTIKEKVTIDLKIEFEFNKHFVRAEYYDHIESVANFLKQYPETKAVIEGHTCNIGSDEYNIDLSLRRAESVKNVLIDHYKIHPKRLSAVGYGMTMPVADNSTEEGREKNRRVIAVISTTVEKQINVKELKN